MSNESDKELYAAFEHGSESRESEIESLRQQLNACRQVKQSYIEELANMQKRDVMLREKLNTLVITYPECAGKDDYEALAATADLEDLVLCDSTVWFYSDDAGDTKPLYMAWEQK